MKIFELIERLKSYTDQNMDILLGDLEYGHFYPIIHAKKRIVDDRDIVREFIGDKNKQVKALVLYF